MAITFSEEALRAVQDTFQIYKTISPGNAANLANTDLSAPGPDTHLQVFGDVVEVYPGYLHLARMAAMDNASGVAGPVLARRRRLGGSAYY